MPTETIQSISYKLVKMGVTCGQQAQLQEESQHTWYLKQPAHHCIESVSINNFKQEGR